MRHAAGSTRLDAQLSFAIYSASLAMGRLHRKLLASLDLTYPQYLVLLALLERESTTVTALGERLYLDSATLTPLLKRLQASRLVTRTRSVEDERSVLVALSDEGRTLARRAESVGAEVVRASCLTAQQLEVLRGSLGQLRERLLEVS